MRNTLAAEGSTGSEYAFLESQFKICCKRVHRHIRKSWQKQCTLISFSQNFSKMLLRSKNLSFFKLTSGQSVAYIQAVFRVSIDIRFDMRISNIAEGTVNRRDCTVTAEQLTQGKT